MHHVLLNSFLEKFLPWLVFFFLTRWDGVGKDKRRTLDIGNIFKNIVILLMTDGN